VGRLGEGEPLRLDETDGALRQVRFHGGHDTKRSRRTGDREILRNLLHIDIIAGLEKFPLREVAPETERAQRELAAIEEKH
jgi:hypothetical protein